MYVSTDEKNTILSATKHVIKQENNQPIDTLESHVLNTLIYSIIKNFIGDPQVFQEKSQELLLNLTCRKLQDFRWYKDMFLTKVMLRPDCKEPYWKEKFIAGLPNLFAEKVRNTLREKYNSQIPYRDLTYGELISYINKEGLAICSNLRLNAKPKKDKITGRRELGDFCEQYGYEPLKAPSKHKKHHHSKRRYSTKKYSSKYDKKENYKDYKKRKSYKKPYKKHNKTSNNKKGKQQASKDIIICYKCGKTGHMAKDCYVKKGIRELDISDELRHQLNKLLLNLQYIFQLILQKQLYLFKIII
ncbi:MAG TPA: zinc finger CCHC domain-containing protein [Ignavibacteriaceae bacterium]